MTEPVIDDKSREELKAFLGDRFAQCIREHSGQGRSGDESFDFAMPYVFDCLPYLESLIGKSPTPPALRNEAVETIIHSIRAFASYGVGVSLNINGVDNVHLQRAIEAAEKLRTFGQPAVEVDIEEIEQIIEKFNDPDSSEKHGNIPWIEYRRKFAEAIIHAAYKKTKGEK